MQGVPVTLLEKVSTKVHTLQSVLGAHHQSVTAPRKLNRSGGDRR